MPTCYQSVIFLVGEKAFGMRKIQFVDIWLEFIYGPLDIRRSLRPC